MRRRSPVPLFLGLLLLSACATLPVPPPAPPLPDDLLQEIRLRGEFFQGLKGLAWATVDSPKDRFRVQEVFLAQRPGLLRMETLGLLGTPQFYLVTDGQEVTLYDPGENRYFHGPYDAHALPFALPLRLSSEEIVSFLLGTPPFLGSVQTSVSQDREKGLWLLKLASVDPDFQQKLWIDPQSLAIRRGEVHCPGISYEFTFSDFRAVDRRRFPYRLSLDVPASGTRILVEFKEIELNPSWKAQDFSLPPPRGATIVPLP
jgi:outer membrane lipoprotein-sorting protein